MRELTPAEIDDLLRRQAVGRIGCHAEGVTYVVPVIYAYEAGAIYVATIEGQKMRMMRSNPRVCFEVDEYERQGAWQSAIVQGLAEELEGPGVEAARTVLARRFSGGSRSGAGCGQAVWLRIRVLEVTGRAVSRDPAAAEHRLRR